MSVANVSPACSVPTRVTAIKQALPRWALPLATSDNPAPCTLLCFLCACWHHQDAGLTALHIAADRGFPASAGALLRAGGRDFASVHLKRHTKSRAGGPRSVP